MFYDNNFLAFHDLSAAGLFLWASSSVTHFLQYDPSEIVGMSPFSLIHPDDLEACRVTHKEHVLNEIVGTHMSFRLRRKDGSYAPCMIFGCLCYQYIISCYSFEEEVNERPRKPIVHGVHSAVMTRIVGSEKEEFERISRNHNTLKSDTWNPANLQLELRACLLLNRFSRNITIMYASPSCELIFNIDPDELLGKPLLLYIRADDLGNFVDQVDQVKSSTALRHIRF
ncbi:hypothetical protein BGZ80_008206, partial [Entomortierella chlamydospora]